MDSQNPSQTSTLVKTVTSTRVAVGVALFAAFLAFANATIPLVSDAVTAVPVVTVQMITPVAGATIDRTVRFYAKTSSKVYSLQFVFHSTSDTGIADRSVRGSTVDGMTWYATFNTIPSIDGDYVVYATSSAPLASGEVITVTSPKNIVKVFHIPLKVTNVRVWPVSVANKVDQTTRAFTITFDNLAENVKVTLSEAGNVVGEVIPLKSDVKGQRVFTTDSFKALKPDTNYDYSVSGCLVGKPEVCAKSVGSFITAKAVATKAGAKPVVSTTALPTTILNAGTNVLSRITISADLKKDIAIKKLSFKVFLSNQAIGFSNTSVRVTGMGTTIGFGSVSKNTSCGLDLKSTERCLTITLSRELIIAAGTSANLELISALSGVTNGDSLMTTLLGDVDAKSTQNFVWSDMSALPHSMTSADWFNGAFIQGLPTQAQTLFRDGTPAATTTSGTISITLDINDSANGSGIVIGGASGVVMAKYMVTAKDEELKVTKMHFGVIDPMPVKSISLYDGTVLVGGPVSVDSSGSADFAGMKFIIGKNSKKFLTVKADLNPVGQPTPVSGTRTYVAFTDNPGTFEARGTSAGSTTLITKNTGSGMVQGPYKFLRKTTPTVSLVSLPSTTLNNGKSTLSRFVIAADAAGDVAVKRITFNVSPAVGVTVDAPTLSEVGQSSSGYAADTTLKTCIGGDYCSFTLDLNSEMVIAAGSTKALEFRANVSGATTGTTIITSIGVGDIFRWSDMSAIPHSMTSADWIAGDTVKGLPSEPQTLSR